MSYHSLPCRVIEGMTRGEYQLLRAELADEQCHVCPYCNNPFPVAMRDQWAHEQVTVEHIEPRSAGGDDDRSNLGVACYSCNSSKADQTLLVFLVRRKEKARRRGPGLVRGQWGERASQRASTSPRYPRPPR